MVVQEEVLEALADTVALVVMVALAVTVGPAVTVAMVALAMEAVAGLASQVPMAKQATVLPQQHQTGRMHHAQKSQPGRLTWIILISWIVPSAKRVSYGSNSVQRMAIYSLPAQDGQNVRTR